MSLDDCANPLPGRKCTSHRILSGLLLLAALALFTECTPGWAAETEKHASDSSGLLNDWLRQEFPAASAWDIGGQFRLRYEAKDAGSFPNRDFAPGLKPGNDCFLFRSRVHVGWSPAKWFAAFAEGQDSQAVSDSRAVPENDSFDLQQAYVRFGNLKNFPFSLKVGRQELIYGDQRYIGNSDWSNFGRSFDAAKLRYDFGSGDRDPADDRNGTLQLLFGTNHRFYGNMDLMGLRNMHIPRMEASLKPAKKVSLSVEWLGFWMVDTADFLYTESSAGRSQNGYGRNPAFSSHVGQEVDLLLDWRATAWGQVRRRLRSFFHW